jgi:tetratricopeptide (TPR) repeat protein
MFDLNDFFNLGDLENLGDYSEPFTQWDEERMAGTPHGYFDPDDLGDILEVYLSMEEVDEGRKVLEYALKMHPDNEDMVCDMMETLNEYERWNDLLALTEKYKKKKWVWVDAQRITALLHVGMEDEAFVCLKLAKEKYAGDTDDMLILHQAAATALNDVDLYISAVKVINEVIEEAASAGKIEEFLWLQVQSFFSLNDKENTLQICEQILHNKPMDADTWNRLGQVYKDLNEKEKAIEAFEFAASLGNDDLSDDLNLIYAYKENGNYLKALEKIDEYLEYSPEEYVVNILAASIAVEIEDWERAIKHTDNALKIDPNSPFLYIYKCRSLLQLGEIKKAINTLEEGLRITGDETGDIRLELRELKRDYPQYRK